LSELLFMEIVRWQLSYIARDVAAGGGVSDPQVGGLALLHAEPARA